MVLTKNDINGNRYRSRQYVLASTIVPCDPSTKPNKRPGWVVLLHFRVALQCTQPSQCAIAVYGRWFRLCRAESPQAMKSSNVDVIVFRPFARFFTRKPAPGRLCTCHFRGGRDFRLHRQTVCCVLLLLLNEEQQRQAGPAL